MKRHQVAPGCFFEPDEDQAVNPVVGTNKKSALTNTPKPYYRTSELDDIPDDFVSRMMKLNKKEVRKEEHEVKMPEGFTVSIAYNKSGYQVITKEDL